MEIHLQKKIQRLQNELKEINDKIGDKQLKLAKAQETLNDMLHQNREVKQAYEANMKELNSLQQEKESVAQGFIAAGTLDTLSDFVKENWDKMEEEEREKYNDSFVEEFAEHPAELIGCATALFLNYIDAATSIAQTAGGGGGPGDGWGKKDDEDDWAWIHRCLQESSKMIGKSKKRGIRR